MARKKHHKKSSTPRRAATHHKKTHKRRRRMGASGVMGKATGLLKDPFMAAIIGSGAGLVVSHFVKKAFTDPKMAQASALAPVAVAFLIRKKYPALAGGMAATPILSMLANLKDSAGKPMIPFLNENGNISFADDQLLLSMPMPLSGQEYSLNDYGGDGGFSEYMDED